MKVFQGSFVLIIIIVFGYMFITNYNNKINIILDSCVDGDTAWFIADGKRIKVRLLGIDTPESTNYIEEYGELASSYTCDKLSSASDIYIELDNNSDKYDKYGRLLGYIFIDGDNLGSLLLANGLAEVKYVYGNYKYLDEFCDIQYKAYNNKLNIWNSYDYTKNYCYKRSDN